MSDALPANPSKYPGLPGGPHFDFNSLPVLGNGRVPTGGPLATDKLIPPGVKHYLSTTAAPRPLPTPKGSPDERIPPDEFALLVEQYNRQFGTTLPVDSVSPLWQQPGGWAGTRNVIAKIAVGRWNAYMCKAGRGHCPDPGFFAQISHALTKIPVVGNIAHIVGEAAAAPFVLAKNIASGERLDHALVGSLKDQVKIVKDVAPYATTVISLVPGIGTGVAAAVAAGAALAEGQSISQAAKAAIRGAIPGGSIAASGFDLAQKVASGENVGKAVLESARASLPAGPAQQAFDIGTAVATGEKIQNAVVRSLSNLAPAQLQTIVSAGEQAVASTPGLSDALKAIGSNPEAAQGFKIAAGVLSHEGAGLPALAAVRAKLTPTAQQGFDAAVASQTPVASTAPTATARPPVATTHPPVMQTPPAKPPATHPPVMATATPKPQSGPKYGPYPKTFALSGPLDAGHGGGGGHGHGGGGHGGHGRGGRRPFFGPGFGPGWGWGGPWTGPDVNVTVNPPPTATCRTWGAPITDMPQAMIWAGRSAVNGSKGQPRVVQGPDGVDYLFSIENGALVARPCASPVT